MDDHSTQSFSRRSFIKGAAALTAAGALVGCSPKSKDLEEVDARQGDPETQIFRGVCRGNCFGGCALNIHVRDGQIVRTSAADLPNPAYNRICSKGLSHMGRVYSSNRVQYPMRRVGERGAGDFERISWDEAIEDITSKWKGYVDEFGSESIAIFSQSGNLGFGGGIHGIGAYFTRFGNIMGFSKVNGNLDWAVNVAGFIAYGGQGMWSRGNEPTDYENASTFVCWGSNPVVSQLHNMHFILEAKEKGTQLIVIDPVYNMTAAKADKYIPINATTDAALALAIINEVVKNGWEDTEFLREHTEAPLLVKADNDLLRMSDLGVAPTKNDVDPKVGKPAIIDPYAVWDEDSNKAVALDQASRPALTGVTEVGGIAVKTTFDYMKDVAARYSLEEVQEITGVPVKTIQALADTYAHHGPVTTYTMYGTDHYTNGHYTCWAIAALGMVCGHSGKPGGATGGSGIAVSELLNNDASTATDSNGNPSKGLGRIFNLDHLNDILDTGTYDDKPLALKGCFIMGANSVAVYAEQEYIKKAMSKFEFIVVSETSMTETAKWADILLPASDWYEQTDMYAACGTHPYLIWNDKAIETMFESKPDYDIFKLLVDNMGYGDFWGWENNEEALAETLNSDALREEGITFKRIKEEKILRILPGEVYRSFEGGTFQTPTKRGRFYQETPLIDTVGNAVDLSRERVPHWEPSLEADKNSEARKTYPFHCLSDHMRTRTHTQWWDVQWLGEVETKPVVKMCPADAAELGIAAGDKVKLYNDRGFVVVNAVINKGLPPKMVSVPRGFQQSEFIDGHTAMLPIMRFNQACSNQPFNDVAVAIEKMQGA